MQLKFKNLEFKEENNRIKIIFLKIFYTYLDKNLLQKLGKYKIKKNSIEVENGKRFNFLLNDSFKNLKNSISNHKTVYIHKNSGIPLIGSNAFGIIDRNTNLIEVKPITSCNLDCIYCSVDEGKSSKKLVDYVVEEEYLVEELKELIRFKECDDIEVHIGTQGEPLLYEPIFDLIKDISKIKQVRRISIDTNGTMLDRDIVDRLVGSGLTQFNLSINALDENTAQIIAGCKYNTKAVIEIAEYIAKKTNLIITPVWLPGYNDKEMEKLVEFCKKLDCKIGIQNFLNYKHGRNPVREMPWESFYEKIKELEKKTSIGLVLGEKEFDIIKTKPLPKPFKKGNVVQAIVMAEGRLKNEKLAVAEDRVITVSSSKKIGEKIKLKITRSKHNVFYGKF